MNLLQHFPTRLGQPREQQKRWGHFRRYKSTKIWVESCIVGLAENVVTIKGYQVS